MPEPLSQSLTHLLERGASERTLNELLAGTHGRGHYLVMILLCLPFMVPLPLPGASMLVGVVLMIMGARMALGQTPHLPRWLGTRRLPKGMGLRLLSGTIRLLRGIEQFIRPRRTRWMKWRSARFGNALLILFMALLLALPIPPIIPFTNTFPACAIIVIAASVMEEDGVMIWLGYAAAAFTVVYLMVLGGAVEALVTRMIARWTGGGGA